jgi:accessory gene regulator protein AgrB
VVERAMLNFDGNEQSHDHTKEHDAQKAKSDDQRSLIVVAIGIVLLLRKINVHFFIVVIAIFHFQTFLILNFSLSYFLFRKESEGNSFL